METNEHVANPEETFLKAPLDVVEIMKLLPHRYPFLLVDRVIEMERKKRIVAIKNITVNEPFFTGHFPGYPIMPGVLLLEALAQAGCILVMVELPDPTEKLIVFTGVEHARFRRPALPGDQVRLEIDVLNWRTRMMRMQGKAYVDGKLICEGTVTSQMVPRNRPLKTEAANEAASIPQEAAVEA